MKNFRRLVFSGMLISVLTFGLAGCGNNHSSAKSASSHKDKTEKVVKNKKKTTKAKKQSSTTKAKKSSASSSISTSSNNGNSTATTNNSNQSTSSSSKVSTDSQKQLGLSDVAVWTDEHGVTHHVDSDGMDRQTISGSSQVSYQDWSGSLPSNAQIIHQN